MAVFAPVGAPTRVDAEAAAEVLIAAGAAEVLLFGSVARGTAGPGSDIDLVAIFADLDYAERAVRRQKLEAVAAAVVSWPVQVHVTDRPEWRWRTRRVCSSFEASVAGEAVSLIDSVVGEVRWDKEIGLAKTNDEEALDRLDDACKHVIAMRSDLRPDSAATWMGRPLSPEEVVAAEHVRILDLCVAAAGAVELTVKALRAAADGEGPINHHVWRLLPHLGNHRAAVETALAPVRANMFPPPSDDAAATPPDFSDVGLLRQAGTYISEFPGVTFDRLADLAPRLCQAAVNVADVAVRHLASPAAPASRLSSFATAADRVREYLAAFSVLSGEPRRGAPTTTDPQRSGERYDER